MAHLLQISNYFQRSDIYWNFQNIYDCSARDETIFTKLFQLPSVATPVISCLNPNLLLFGSTQFTDSLWYRPAITRLPPKEVKIGANLNPNLNRHILFQRTEIEKEESDESAQLVKTGIGKSTRGWNRASVPGGERESCELVGAKAVVERCRNYSCRHKGARNGSASSLSSSWCSGFNLKSIHWM